MHMLHIVTHVHCCAMCYLAYLMLAHSLLLHTLPCLLTCAHMSYTRTAHPALSLYVSCLYPESPSSTRYLQGGLHAFTHMVHYCSQSWNGTEGPSHSNTDARRPDTGERHGACNERLQPTTGSNTGSAGLQPKTLKASSLHNCCTPSPVSLPCHAQYDRHGRCKPACAHILQTRSDQS